MAIDEADLVPRKLAWTYQDSKLDLYVQGVHLDGRTNGPPQTRLTCSAGVGCLPLLWDGVDAAFGCCVHAMKNYYTATAELSKQQGRNTPN